MPAKLKPCPFDASPDVAVENPFDAEYRVCCSDCGATGPKAPTWAEAEKLWNARRKPGASDAKH